MSACGSACGKAILLGEHAVVYGRPAIAVPVPARRAVAEVRAAPAGSGIVVVASELQARYLLGASDVDEHGRFLLAAVEGALAATGAGSAGTDLEVHVRSSIPMARGMGSGAAVSAAIARAIAAHRGITLSRERLSELVFATERLLHGTPSGIDNTVVAYEAPVWFRRGQEAEVLAVAKPLTLVIGDTGIPSRTHESVAWVRRRWEADPASLEAVFDAIGEAVERGREALLRGDVGELGALMDRNQALLEQLGVSDPALENLILAARRAGALGAKLSGGGMGGCMLALATPDEAQRVQAALCAAGAVEVIVATVTGPAAV